MYVDRPLAGARAVKVLSRLNRTHPQIRRALVINFVNQVKAVRASTSTYVSLYIFILIHGIKPNESFMEMKITWPLPRPLCAFDLQLGPSAWARRSSRKPDFLLELFCCNSFERRSLQHGKGPLN